MALSRFQAPFFDAGSGIKPSDGAQLFFFETGTGVPKDTFNCPDGTFANSNPVIANSVGVFPDIFFSGTFKVILKDKNDNQEWEADPVSSFILTSETSFDFSGTLAEATADVSVVAGQTWRITDRADGLFDVVTGQTPNLFDVVDHDTLSLQFKLRRGGRYNIKQFGCALDGSTDDADALEFTITECVNDMVDIDAPGGTVCFVGRTILILQQPTFSDQLTLGFNNITFKTSGDFTLFESAYDNGGTLTTTVGTAFGAHNSFSVKLQSFVIDSAVTPTTTPALNIQDWHQGAEISEISSDVTGNVLHSHGNFYCVFDDIKTQTPAKTPGARFIFSGPHNLNSFKKLVAGNSTIGYNFLGGLTACTLDNISFEGMDIGIQFDGEIFDCEIVNSYFENIADTMISVQDTCHGLKMSNNYFNFQNQAGTFLLDYQASSNNNIIFRKDNFYNDMVSDASFIKVINGTLGFNELTFNFPQDFAFGGIDDFVVDNANFPDGCVINQVLDATGLRTEKANRFAKGQYALRMSRGYDVTNGFEWNDTASNAISLKTKLVSSTTQRIYVNIRVAGTSLVFYEGEFIGNNFYEFGTAAATNALTLTTVSGFLQINGTHAPGNVTGILGEVRLV